MTARSAWSNAGVGVGVLVVGLVAVCAGVLACGVGAWVFLGPVNYLGCGTERPNHVSEADLIGTYETRDGARMELKTGNMLVATALARDSDGARLDLSGPGTWTLQSGHTGAGDIDLSLTAKGRPGYLTSLYISGSRKQPWMYWFDGDPDGCNLYRFNRVA
ncbi:hypothetical protein ACFFWC_31470 [Plantactinospora siamensis]|uniref:Uncharacterized protein n=1 Tax=Plantactinospora siamensis TaxID=555372 RepID=A0ABV6P552_9ACTN